MGRHHTIYAIELVQNCTTPEIIAQVRDELFSAGDFWVINVNELIGDNKTFEYGYDFLFEFGFNDPKNSEHFKDKLNEWRGMVYTSLAPRISLLTQMLAMIYVQLIDTRGEHEALTEGTVWKCRFIDNEFAYNDAITRLLDFYLYQHPKEELVDFVDGLIKQMIAMANVYLLQAAENKFNSLAELNDEIIRENERIKDLYPRKEMAKRF